MNGRSGPKRRRSLA